MDSMPNKYCEKHVVTDVLTTVIDVVTTVFEDQHVTQQTSMVKLHWPQIAHAMEITSVSGPDLDVKYAPKFGCPIKFAC